MKLAFGVQEMHTEFWWGKFLKKFIRPRRKCEHNIEMNDKKYVFTMIVA
jgi:hypothetical protein